jgi:hypothetical protein
MKFQCLKAILIDEALSALEVLMVRKTSEKTYRKIKRRSRCSVEAIIKKALKNL